MNTVNLIGRLTRDADMKYTTGGLPVAGLSLAVNERRKQGEQWADEPSFFDVTLFGRQAEALAQYLTKGKQIGVAGKLRQDRWKTPEGDNRSRVVVIADSVDLLGSARQDGQGPQARPQNGPADPQDPLDYPDNIPF